MKIIIAHNAGFCKGVSYTIKKTYEILAENNSVYSLGEIVHNNFILDKLISDGLIIKDNLDEIPYNQKVIFRAHGEGEDIYKKAKDKNLDIIDLTCGKVKLIHHKIIKEKDDNYIVIIGKKNHPETIAHYSYAKDISIIENYDDINAFINQLKHSNKNKIYIVAQTTFNDYVFDELVSEIEKKCNGYNIRVDKTICKATKTRQDEVKELAKKVDKMIIIGGKNSSNTKELACVSQKYCHNTYLIESVENLKEYILNQSDTVGISAGASTPDELINEVVNYLQTKYI